MKLKFKLYAGLDQYLPAGAQDHCVLVEVDPDATANSIIDRFGVPREKAHLVLLNGEFIAPGQRDRPTFKEGDTLAVWPPVAGG